LTEMHLLKIMRQSTDKNLFILRIHIIQPWWVFITRWHLFWRHGMMFLGKWVIVLTWNWFGVYWFKLLVFKVLSARFNNITINRCSHF
jgi:hypothetical protein